ncbi:MAG: sulfatase-like hydrolase/transferase [Planctomycetota bacterium]|nr:sulfatase-like hydrolase/transferase [Planctomycetota bacterium]
MLQLQFADLWLGRILDRLEETEQLDEALIVVTADHGMAFVPGTGRRIPTAATLPDIASVPLFIKQPGQHNAVVSDKNVETIDILPTMTEILGLPDDSAWDGVSVLHDGPQRPRKTIRSPDTIIEPDFSQRFQYVDRMIQVFGSGSNHDRLGNLNTIPELVGQDVVRVVAGRAVSYQCRLSSGGTEFDPQYPNYVPCYFRGTLSDKTEGQSPKQLALALNGVILATTRTSTDAAFLHQWAALLPDSAFRQEGNHVQLYEVESRDQTHMLLEIPIRPTRL